MANLQEQLESLVHEVASYNASSKAAVAPKRVGVFRVSWQLLRPDEVLCVLVRKSAALTSTTVQEPDINGRTVPKDPYRFPLGVVNGDYAAAVVPDTCEPPAHLVRFKESNFVDTSTHTRLSLCFFMW